MEYRDLRIDELHNHIEEGLAFVEPRLNKAVTEAILNYGVEEDNGERSWVDRSAIDVVREIKKAIEQTLSEGLNSSGEDASNEQLDFLRCIYVRFLVLGRFCKDNPVEL